MMSSAFPGNDVKFAGPAATSVNETQNGPVRILTLHPRLISVKGRPTMNPGPKSEIRTQSEPNTQERNKHRTANPKEVVKFDVKGGGENDVKGGGEI